jgi:DnaJ-class molecular chaperone
MMRNLYEVLKVAPGASPDTIVHAYRQQARASHPDARPDDPSAAARFRMLTNAYDVLSDPVRRAQYDRTRAIGAARPLHPSGGYGSGQIGLTGNGELRIGGGKAPDVFLDARQPRSSGPPLWAGPVRVEASPNEAVAEFPLGRLAALLHSLMTDGSSE